MGLKLVEDKGAMREYIEPRQIFDVVAQNPAKLEAQTLVDCLRKLQARLYSIASSQAEVEDEVHLTIALVEFEAFVTLLSHLNLSKLSCTGKSLKIAIG